MGNVDVVIPVYKPDKKLQMVISRLMGQTIVPSNIFLIHTRSSEDDWHTEQLLQEVQTEYSVVQVVSIAQEGIPCIQKRVRSWRYETDGSKKVFCGCLRDDDTGCHAEEWKIDRDPEKCPG